ncbi:glycosyltransferase family 2 protein [bacterium]|nr:glycosyltransferase family 2 protein [bacterium]
MVKFLVIIPAYNEEMNIAQVVRSVDETRSILFDALLDIVVVNDGSADRTLEAAESTGVIVLDLPYNLGIGGAVQTGFRYAFEQGYDVAIQIDGDGQHDPKFLPQLIAPIVSGTHDVAIGSRFLDSSRAGFQSTFTRRIGIKMFEWINSVIIRQKITDNTSGFRAYNKKTIAMLAHEYPADYPEPETVIMLGLRNFRIAEIPVVMKERQGGRSSIGAWVSWFYMVKVLLAIFVNVFKKHR